MDPEFLLRPGSLAHLLAAAGMLAIAAALLWVRFYSPAVRWFAMFLGLRAASFLVITFRGAGILSGNLAEAEYWNRLFPYTIIPIPFVLARFIAVYPRPRTWLGKSRLAPWSILAAVAALLGLYAMDRSLWETFGVNVAGGFYSPTAQGPLVLLLGMMFVAYALVALAAAVGFTQAESATERHSLLLVSLAFAVNALFDQSGAVLLLLQGTSNPNAYLQFVGILLTVAAAVHLARHALQSKDPAVRRSVRGYLLLLPLPVVTGLSFAFASTAVYGFFLGLWRLVLPLVVMYALVRHHLFDLDIKVKWTIKQSTVAAVFIGFFFVVSETVSNVLAPSVGPFLGIVAAGLLLFAMAPLQHFAERIASAAVPQAKQLESMSKQERLGLYRDQAKAAWEDGSLTKAERRVLDVSRERLGLTAEEAAHLEREAMAG